MKRLTLADVQAIYIPTTHFKKKVKWSIYLKISLENKKLEYSSVRKFFSKKDNYYENSDRYVDALHHRFIYNIIHVWVEEYLYTVMA